MISIERKQAEDILKIFEAKGFEARFAGGCVRDFLLGIEPVDYDIATVALPHEVMDIFSSRPGYKALPTGIDHGTVTIIFNKLAFEVTTLREDVATNGRHADVVFGTDFQLDAMRRDFTMNAMFQDLSGKIYDFFQGREDLENKEIKFVGNAEERIKEDHLRILRYYRFQARLNLKTDEQTLSTIQKHANLLRNISRERISSEMKGILNVQYLQEVLPSMENRGVFKALFPDAEISSVDMLDLSKRLERLGGFVERLCLFCLALPGLSPQMLFESLKLTKKMLKKLEACVYGYKVIRNQPPEDEVDILLLWDTWERMAGPGCGTLVYNVLAEACDGSSEKTHLTQFLDAEHSLGSRRRKTLPLNGRDLLQEFPLSGQQVGDMLLCLRKEYYKGRWEHRDEGLDIAREIYANLSV